MRLVMIFAVLLAVLLAAADAQDKKPDKDAFELGDLVDIPLFFKEMHDLEKLRVEARRLQVNTHNLMALIGEKEDSTAFVSGAMVPFAMADMMKDTPVMWILGPMTGRNPLTGEAIQIPAKTVVKFTLAKSLKDLIA